MTSESHLPCVPFGTGITLSAVGMRLSATLSCQTAHRAELRHAVGPPQGGVCMGAAHGTITILADAWNHSKLVAVQSLCSFEPETV